MKKKLRISSRKEKNTPLPIFIYPCLRFHLTSAEIPKNSNKFPLQNEFDFQPFWARLQPERRSPYKYMENVGNKSLSIKQTYFLYGFVFKLRILAALIHAIMMASVSSVERMTLNVIVREDTPDLSVNVS